MAGPDPIARAECAQYLFRRGVTLTELHGNEQLRTLAVARLIEGGAAIFDASAMVEHLAEVYKDGGP